MTTSEILYSDVGGLILEYCDAEGLCILSETNQEMRELTKTRRDHEKREKMMRKHTVNSALEKEPIQVIEYMLSITPHDFGYLDCNINFKRRMLIYEESEFVHDLHRIGVPLNPSFATSAAYFCRIPMLKAITETYNIRPCDNVIEGILTNPEYGAIQTLKFLEDKFGIVPTVEDLKFALKFGENKCTNVLQYVLERLPQEKVRAQEFIWIAASPKISYFSQDFISFNFIQVQK
jgi:hypothetical protein